MFSDPQSWYVMLMVLLQQSEIINTLPKIAALLAKPEEKPLVRSLFESIITPPHTFGSISTNVQRMQQNELLTPVELLATLHHQEKALGIKLTREGKPDGLMSVAPS